MKKGSDDGGSSKPNFFGHDSGYGDGVENIRFPAFSAHVFVCIERKVKGFSNLFFVGWIANLFGGCPQQTSITAKNIGVFILQGIRRKIHTLKDTNSAPFF
jgi:hypothetical protein